jgi:hypothetical protein
MYNKSYNDSNQVYGTYRIILILNYDKTEIVRFKKWSEVISLLRLSLLCSVFHFMSVEF